MIRSSSIVSLTSTSTIMGRSNRTQRFMACAPLASPRLADLTPARIGRAGGPPVILSWRRRIPRIRRFVVESVRLSLLWKNPLWRRRP
jgi:hypothetical protein